MATVPRSLADSDLSSASSAPLVATAASALKFASHSNRQSHENMLGSVRIYIKERGAVREAKIKLGVRRLKPSVWRGRGYLHSRFGPVELLQPPPLGHGFSLSRSFRLVQGGVAFPLGLPQPGTADVYIGHKKLTTRRNLPRTALRRCPGVQRERLKHQVPTMRGVPSCGSPCAVQLLRTASTAAMVGFQVFLAELEDGWEYEDRIQAPRRLS